MYDTVSVPLNVRRAFHIFPVCDQ